MILVITSSKPFYSYSYSSYLFILLYPITQADPKVKALKNIVLLIEQFKVPKEGNVGSFLSYLEKNVTEINLN